MTPAPDGLDYLRAQVDALHSVIGLLVAVVALSPLTDDDKVEIQRRWAAINSPRCIRCTAEGFRLTDGLCDGCHQAVLQEVTE